MPSRDLNQWCLKLDQPLQTKWSGELVGKTFTLKDLFFFSNYPTTASTKAKIEKLSDSPLVELLLDQGASFLGKVHTHEIALGLFGWNPIAGQALNPHDPTRITGGSSSGSAVTVANNECDFSLGTDTGGSIRTPSAFCGIYGFKPTLKRISTKGILPLSKTMDHVGIMARELAIIKKVFSILAHSHASPPHLRIAKGKIGLWDVEDWVEPSVWKATTDLAEKFSKSGHKIEKFLFNPPGEVYRTILVTEGASQHRAALLEQAPAFGESTLEMLRLGLSTPAVDYIQALESRIEIQSEVNRLFDSFDFLIGPTVPCVAPKLETKSIMLPEGELPLRQTLVRLTSPWSLVGVPALNIPIPLDGLFAGAQLIAQSGSDEELLEFAINSLT